MPRRLGQVVMLVAVIALGITAYWFATRGSAKRPAAPPPPVLAEIHRPAGIVKTGAASTKGERLHSDAGTLQLEGQVIDDQLTPVAGAQVTLLLDEPRKTTSEADGSYSFANLAPGPYRLVAHKDAQSSSTTRARLSATSDPVTLRMRPGATVVVTVVAADGEIVATHPTLGSSGTRTLSPKVSTLDLVIAPVGGIDGVIVGGTEREHIVNVRLVTGEKTRYSAQVDATNAFKLDDLVPGDYDVKLFGAGKATPPAVRVTVVANQRTPAVITMPSSTITLAVHHAADCDMVLVEPPGEGQELIADARCDDKGNAVIEGLAPGTYRVCTISQACATATITPTPARQTLEIPVKK